MGIYPDRARPRVWGPGSGCVGPDPHTASWRGLLGLVLSESPTYETHLGEGCGFCEKKASPTYTRSPISGNLFKQKTVSPVIPLPVDSRPRPSLPRPPLLRPAADVPSSLVPLQQFCDTILQRFCDTILLAQELQWHVSTLQVHPGSLTVGPPERGCLPGDTMEMGSPSCPPPHPSPPLELRGGRKGGEKRFWILPCVPS